MGIYFLRCRARDLLKNESQWHPIICTKFIVQHLSWSRYPRSAVLRIAKNILHDNISAIARLLNDHEVLHSASDETTMFPEFFSENYNLCDSGSPLPVFKTNLKPENIYFFRRNFCQDKKSQKLIFGLIFAKEKSQKFRKDKFSRMRNFRTFC